MRLTRTRSLVAAGAVALAGAATAAVLVAVPASAKPTIPASSHPAVLVECSGKGLVKPTKYDAPFCMPSSQYISGVSWTNWQTNAFGAGTFKVNSCNPSCASGKYINYAILVVLWRAEPWTHHSGQKYFSRMTVIFTGKRPQGTHTAAQTFDLSATGAP
jgi:hypothetical protein